ncbi:hypothetical protein [Mammaliicoccus lentus]|nr:hypothetical protein [Mammaliicoccus lentus]
MKAHNKESIGIAFAYTGVIVGAGFSTGQGFYNSLRILAYGASLALY